MRHMSRAAAVALAVAAIWAVQSSSAVAQDVQVGDFLRFEDGPGTVGGGEYDVEVNGVADKFVAFCIQRNEDLHTINQSPQPFYVYDVSDHAEEEENAGNGGIDPLSPLTAYLYYAFRTGTLVNGYAGDDAAANALQTAMWVLEDELGIGALGGVGTLAHKYYLEAVAAAWTDIGDVRIANLVFTSGNPAVPTDRLAQDVLVLIPEPASMLAWTLIGGCFIVGHRFRRKLAA